MKPLGWTFKVTDVRTKLSWWILRHTKGEALKERYAYHRLGLLCGDIRRG